MHALSRVLLWIPLIAGDATGLGNVMWSWDVVVICEVCLGMAEG